MSDLVERLRAASVNHDEFRFGWLAEAIDEIGRLRAEVVSLTAQCEGYRWSFAGAVKVNDNLRAENAKLRERIQYLEICNAAAGEALGRPEP